ncbi:MAG: DUF1552 domain-containing protein [Armatimonadaceae bacterium]
MSQDRRPEYIHPVTRRAVLRGLGMSLTMPFFSSLAWAQNGKRDTAEQPPRRLAVMLFANGVNEDHWWQKADANGRITELSKTLQPLMPFRDEILFLNNLHLFDNTVGVHLPFFTNFLSGTVVGSGSIPNGAESFDQTIGRVVGKTVPVPVITLGIEPAGFGLAGGKPAIYNSTVSWSSPTTPVAPEIFPRQAFDRLFDTSSLMRDRSVLHYLNTQANDLRRSLSRDDRAKLDEYLTTIREIEKRIELATAEGRLEGWQPTLDKPDMPRPADGLPQNIPEHMRLMLDIMVLGLRMDKTRVSTLLFQRDITGMRFNFLDGVSASGMHDISHHRRRAETLAEYQRINQFHVEQLAYVLARMKSVDEGNGTTLLDNTMVLFGSTMSDGDTHEANRLPLLLAGGKSAGIRGGRALQYDKLEDRRLCNLYLDLAHRMGVPLERFGNSHYRLPGLG